MYRRCGCVRWTRLVVSVLIRMLLAVVLVARASMVQGAGEVTTTVLFHATTAYASSPIDERLSLTVTLATEPSTSPSAIQCDLVLHNSGPGEITLRNPVIALNDDLRTSDGVLLGLDSQTDTGFQPNADSGGDVFRLIDFGGFTFISEDRGTVTSSRPSDTPLLRLTIGEGQIYSARIAIEKMRVGGDMQPWLRGEPGRAWGGPTVAGPLQSGLYRLQLITYLEDVRAETDWIDVDVVK